MFVSASLFLDYRSERPPAAVGPLTAVRRGLSGTGWKDEGDIGRHRAVAGEIDTERRDATRLKPVGGPRADRRDRSVGRNRGFEGACGLLGVLAFVLDRGEVPERGVSPSGVVPALDVLEH